MNAAEALQAARAAGIQVEIDGADLLLKASAPPPPAVLDGLSQYKARILALLRPAKAGWVADDWRSFFHERPLSSSTVGCPDRRRMGRPSSTA